MNFIKKMFLLILLGFFAGCSSTYVRKDVILPYHIKKISIAGFKDITQHKLMQEKLKYTVKEEFVNDRRIEITNEQCADAVLFGEITRYIVEPIEYDENFVAKRYKLWIWIDISLVDCSTQELLWTEKRMESKVEFGVSIEEPFAPSTEVEAQDIAVLELSKDIVKRTIDGWFAASGVSEKL
ncbi:hypothetical protein ACFL4O_03145 [bacterium]